MADLYLAAANALPGCGDRTSKPLRILKKNLPLVCQRRKGTGSSVSVRLKDQTGVFSKPAKVQSLTHSHYSNLDLDERQATLTFLTSGKNLSSILMREPDPNCTKSVRLQTKYMLCKTSEHSIGFYVKTIQEKNLQDSLLRKLCRHFCSEETFIPSSSLFSSVNRSQTGAQIHSKTSIVRSHFW